jgi:hypothetical protein
VLEQRQYRASSIQTSIRKKQSLKHEPTRQKKDALVVARRDLVNEKNWEEDYIKKIDISRDELYACLDLDQLTT